MRTCAVLVLLVLTSMAVAQAEDARSNLSYKATGATIYDLKLEVVLAPTPDTSTARGVVMAWTALADESGNSDAEPSEAEVKSRKLVEVAIAEAEAAVLTKALATTQSEARAGKSKPPGTFTRQPAQISEETTRDDGSVEIVTTQTSEQTYEDRNGTRTAKSETYMRYVVMKGTDGKWRINTIEQAEQAQMVPKGSKSDGLVWRPYRDYRLEMAIQYAGEEKSKLKKPEFASATPEETALSFANTLRRFNDALSVHVMVLGCKAAVAVSEAWFTEDYKAAVRKRIEERNAKAKPDNVTMEVEEVPEATGSTFTVIFKFTDSKASDKLVVKVLKEDGAWKVTEVGDLKNAGKDTEKYEPKKDIYRRW